MDFLENNEANISSAQESSSTNIKPNNTARKANENIITDRIDGRKKSRFSLSEPIKERYFYSRPLPGNYFSVLLPGGEFKYMMTASFIAKNINDNSKVQLLERPIEDILDDLRSDVLKFFL